MGKISDVEIAICHEWGHALMCYYVMGNSDNIECIEIVDNYFAVQGHTTLSFVDCCITTEQKALILYGGIVAENICGYSKVSLHAGTDAKKLRTLIPDKLQRDELRYKALQMFGDNKKLLVELTEKTFSQFPKVIGTNSLIHYRINHDDLAKQINDITR